MTRSIEIANTSNWDGEDYEIKGPEGDYTFHDGAVTLRPGQSLTLTPKDGDEYGIEPVDRNGGESAPFMLCALGAERQVTPNVDGSFTVVGGA